MNIKGISTPTLLLDAEICNRNIERLYNKVLASKILFRPHFKTHQSRLVGSWFRDKGIDKITVSSASMAGYFAANGWKDITIAFPFNPLEYDKIAVLTEKCRLCVTVTGQESARRLTSLCRHKLDVMIKIDTGYNRSGLRWDDRDSINDTINILATNPLLTLRGLLSHTGDTYHASSVNDIASLYNSAVYRMITSRGFTGDDDLIISLGDTPSASIISDYSVVDELRPGNFVFYDLMQANLGVCTPGDIAVAVACPVVDIRKFNKSIVIYGGAIHFSKEAIMIKGEKVFGRVVRLTAGGWESGEDDVYITSLSQEHGIISDQDGLFENFRIGDLVGIQPVHSCLTANLLGGYLLTDGRRADHMKTG